MLIFSLQSCAHSFFDELRIPTTTMPDRTPLMPELFQYTTEELTLATPEVLTILHSRSSGAVAGAAGSGAAPAVAPLTSAPVSAATTSSASTSEAAPAPTADVTTTEPAAASDAAATESAAADVAVAGTN